MAQMTFDTDSIKRVVIESCRGDIRIGGGEQAQIQVDGDRNLAGRVAQHGGDLVIRAHSGNLRLEVATGTNIVARRVSGDVTITHAGDVELARVAGDLDLTDVRGARVEDAAGDFELDVTGTAEIGRVGGDLHITRASAFNVGMVGGDLRAEQVEGEASIGRVGGDLEIAGVTSLHIGGVGGDASLSGTAQLSALGHVGGDLRLEWSGALEGDVHGVVGGDAQITLTENANLVLRAVVGGDISGDGLSPTPAGETHTAEDWAATEEGGSEEGWDSLAGGELAATFGEGGHELRLTIGGDLDLHGGQVTNSTFSPHVAAHVGGHDFGIGDEMRRFGREMKAMAREVAREMRMATRIPGSRPRVHVQVNDKAIHFDAEQIDRITRQAREAAAEGIARAQEAVERALVNIVSGGRGVVPPRPPMPRRPFAPGAPGIHPGHRGGRGRPGFTGQTVRIEREPAASEAPPRSEEEVRVEKLAILRMVSEGRLGVDEAEVMLRALEPRS